MLAEARTRLATQQAELLRALCRKGQAPSGFAPDRIQATADSLVRKRARSAAHAWPALAHALGVQFSKRFSSFAEQHPLPPYGGPLADGLAFAQFLADKGELPDAGKIERLACKLRFISGKDGLRAKQGIGIGFAWLPRLKRLVFVVRMPRLGEKWIKVPLPWKSLAQSFS